MVCSPPISLLSSRVVEGHLQLVQLGSSSQPAAVIGTLWAGHEPQKTKDQIKYAHVTGKGTREKRIVWKRSH